MSASFISCLHSLCAQNFWLTSDNHCVSFCFSIHQVTVCSLNPVAAIHWLSLTRLSWDGYNNLASITSQSATAFPRFSFLNKPWSCVLLLLSLAVPTVSCSVLVLLEPALPPKRLLGWLTMRERVSRGFSAAFTVLAMLGLENRKLTCNYLANPLFISIIACTI